MEGRLENPQNPSSTRKDYMYRTKKRTKEIEEKKAPAAMYPPGIEGDGEEFSDGHRFLSQLSRGDAGIARIILRKWGGSTVRERGIGRDGKERRGTARGGLAPERRSKEEETGHLLTQSLTVLSMPHVAIRPGARAEKEKEEQVFVCILAFHRGAEGALREMRSRKGSDTGGSSSFPNHNKNKTAREEGNLAEKLAPWIHRLAPYLTSQATRLPSSVVHRRVEGAWGHQPTHSGSACSPGEEK